MRIGADRLVVRPFATEDLDEFRKLLDIPDVPGWQISSYAKMDVVHGVVCFGVFDRTSGPGQSTHSLHRRYGPDGQPRLSEGRRELRVGLCG